MLRSQPRHFHPWYSLLFLLFYTLSATAAETAPEPRPLNILLLSSYSQNYASAQEVQAGLDDVLHYRAGANNMYVEYFDSARIPDEKTGRHFAEHLQAKYEDIHFDHVLVWHVTAINFIQQHPDLFPGAKVISFEGPRMEDSGDASWFNVEQDFDGALAEVKRLYAPRKLYVILELADVNGRTRLANFERAQALHMPDVEIEYLIDRPLADVTALLEQQHPQGTAAIYLLSFTSIGGQPTSPNAVYAWLSAHTTIPIFSFWQTLIGNGLPGGLVFSHRQAGRSVAQVVLDPQAVERGAVLDTDVYAYDWPLMQKWGIDTSLIPEDAVVINRPINILDAYRYEIATVSAVLVLLIALSLTLARTLFARTSEVKALQGFIPICSYCKNVRHDTGYWQRVEAYISAQTAARFSHGICPDCMKEHHPDVHG